MVIADHLFLEELGWEWVTGWEVGPVKAMVILVMLVHPPTSLYHPFHQLWSARAWAPVPSHPPSLPKELVAGPNLMQLIYYRPRWVLRYGSWRLGDYSGNHR